MALFPELKKEFHQNLRELGLDDEEIAQQLPYMFEEYWARPNQKEPEYPYYIWMLLAGRGFGKGLALDTRVPTPNGFTTMGELKVGDTIYGGDGKPANVIALSNINNIDCYKIIFDDGSEIIADGEHRWSVTTRETRKIGSNKSKEPEVVLVNTRQLYLEQVADDGRVNFAIETSDIYSKTWDRINPFLFGVYLGCCDANETRIDNPELLEKIKKEMGNFIGYDIVDNVPVGFRAELKRVGALGEKCIPEHIFFASNNYKTKIIEGLLAAGALVVKCNNLLYNTKNSRLKRDLSILLASMGYKVHKNKNGITWCWLKKNANKRVNKRFIKSVEKHPTVSTICISVDSPDKTYLVTENFIRTHNTRTGAEWVRKRVESGVAKRIALIGRTPADASKIMLYNRTSGLMAVCPPWNKPKHNKVDKTLTWKCDCCGDYKCPEAPQALIFSSYEPEKIRGHEFDTVWGDEFAAWYRLDETWFNIEMATRADEGAGANILLSTTPKPVLKIRELAKSAKANEKVIDKDTNLPTNVTKVVMSSGSTFDNKANLPSNYIQVMQEQYGGTELGKQEIFGQILEDLSGTYWSQSTIDAFRIDPEDLEYRDEAGNLLDLSPEAKKLKFIDKNIEKIAIGVDPGFSDGKDAGETGIVVAGIDSDGEAYILEDGSAQMSPSAWAKKISKLYHKYLADVVIAETNHGQKIVLTNISVHDPTIRIRGVHAKKGKKTRAQPISTLYERGKVHHLGSKKDFEKLEEQMTTWTEEGKSPDRIDALVWVLTYLLVDALYYGQIESTIIEREDDDEMSTEALKDIGLFGSVSGSMWDNGDSDLGSFTMWD